MKIIKVKLPTNLEIANYAADKLPPGPESIRMAARILKEQATAKALASLVKIVYVN